MGNGTAHMEGNGMNRATVKRLERLLNPPEDGIGRELVGLDAMPEGYRCDLCGKIHATLSDAASAHPRAVLLVEQIVMHHSDSYATLNEKPNVLPLSIVNPSSPPPKTQPVVVSDAKTHRNQPK